MEACKKAELYPDIWDYDDEKDEIIEEIADYFESMKDFYREVLAAKGSVMVTIC
jgi:protein yfbM